MLSISFFILSGYSIAEDIMNGVDSDRGGWRIAGEECKNDVDCKTRIEKDEILMAFYRYSYYKLWDGFISAEKESSEF